MDRFVATTHTAFQDCRVRLYAFLDNLSRNSLGNETRPLSQGITAVFLIPYINRMKWGLLYSFHMLNETRRRCVSHDNGDHDSCVVFPSVPNETGSRLFMGQNGRSFIPSIYRTKRGHLVIRKRPFFFSLCSFVFPNETRSLKEIMAVFYLPNKPRPL